jgi:UDP-glucose 4-epimerase
MNVLVTGAAGFIGSHTCVELLAAGHSVIALDNLNNSKAQALDAVRTLTGKPLLFYQGDILDSQALDMVFKENKIDAVIHFAGLKAVGESVRKPLLYYQNNVCGTISLCRAMRRHACKRMVFSSSATVYGMDNPVPFREDYPTSATNPYGQTKVMIERILADVCAENPDWSAVLLRYFNPIGAHPSGLLGEDPNGIPNNLLPYVAKVAAGELSELSVFGNDYDRRTARAVRDLYHVADLAAGHLAALDYAAAHTGAVAVNLGTGRGTSVLEIVSAFSKASGREIPYKIAPRRAGDIAVCYADVSKAKALLGWEALRGVDEMCRDGWNFIQNRH